MSARDEIADATFKHKLVHGRAPDPEQWLIRIDPESYKQMGRELGWTIPQLEALQPYRGFAIVLVPGLARAELALRGVGSLPDATLPL